MNNNYDPMRSLKIVTVCASCLTETCVQTSLKCADAATAGVITDTEENIAARQSGEAEMDNDVPKGLEIIGPFINHRVTIGDYEVPRLCAVRHDGRISLTLDHRFGCDIPDDENACSVIWLLANAMAIGAGYSCFGENSRPANQFKRRLTGISFAEFEDGPIVHAESEQ